MGHFSTKNILQIFPVFFHVKIAHFIFESSQDFIIYHHQGLNCFRDICNSFDKHLIFTKVPSSEFFSFEKKCFIKHKLITLKKVKIDLKISQLIYSLHIAFPALYIFSVHHWQFHRNMFLCDSIPIFNWFNHPLGGSKLFEGLWYLWGLLFHYWLLTDMFKLWVWIYQVNNITYLL